MTSGRILVMAATCVAAVLGASGGVAEARDPSNRFAAELLQSHNEERAEFGVPALNWNPELAQQAQGWAEQLAREGRMRHASNDERSGAGENLWMGSAGNYSAQFMVEAFAEEKRHFRAGTFPNVSRTGSWRDVGHFTQVVWPDTREIGCALARDEHNDFLVCRYWPAGNTYGQDIG